MLDINVDSISPFIIMCCPVVKQKIKTQCMYILCNVNVITYTKMFNKNVVSYILCDVVEHLSNINRGEKQCRYSKIRGTIMFLLSDSKTILN